MEVVDLEGDPVQIISWGRIRVVEPSLIWWRNRTMVEQSLIGVHIIAAIMIIWLSVAASTSQPSTETDRPYCETAICLQQAYYLIDSMNTTVDPCNDFYEFACGGYIEKTQIPHSAIEVTPSTRIQDYVLSQLRNEVDESSLLNDIEPYVVLREMYATCMDTAAIEKSGLHQMKLLLQKLGGWPILEKDKWVESDWINVTQKIRHHGFDAFQFIQIDINHLKDASKYGITLDEWTSVDDKSYPNYKDYLTKLALLFGAEPEFAAGEVDAVMEFRAKLSKFEASQAEDYNIGELQAQFPSIPWLDVLNVALEIPKVVLTNQTPVTVMSPTYISEFEKVIRRTPKRVQVNHALFEIIRSRINCLPNNIRETGQQFLANATGVTKATERWRTCIEMVTEHFHIAINALYMRISEIDNAIDDINEVVSNIKNMFINRLKKIEWMNHGIKEIAVKKAENMTVFLAYPMELHNENFVTEYYGDIRLHSDFLLDQVIQMSKFKKDKLRSLYQNPVKKGDWIWQIPSFTTNAVYNTHENSLYIPSGIMQFEIYTFGRPKFMNYGGLGFVIAHEITHGFESIGNLFDDSTEYAFAGKAQCLIKQYNSYSLPGTNFHLNGKNTLGENFADNDAVKTAYLAYLEWIEKNEQDPTLPGLNLTDKQLFWLSLANAQCSKYRQSYQEKLLKHLHAPNRFRILGSLSNTQYFAKDFNCPLGSNMNPVKKCDLWQ